MAPLIGAPDSQIRQLVVTATNSWRHGAELTPRLGLPRLRLRLSYNAVTQVLPATSAPKAEGEFPYRQRQEGKIE